MVGKWKFYVFKKFEHQKWHFLACFCLQGDLFDKTLATFLPFLVSDLQPNVPVMPTVACLLQNHFKPFYVFLFPFGKRQKLLKLCEVLWLCPKAPCFNCHNFPILANW